LALKREAVRASNNADEKGTSPHVRQFMDVQRDALEVEIRLKETMDETRCSLLR
jgi:hypothetical protein